MFYTKKELIVMVTKHEQKLPSFETPSRGDEVINVKFEGDDYSEDYSINDFAVMATGDKNASAVADDGGLQIFRSQLEREMFLSSHRGYGYAH